MSDTPTRPAAPSDALALDIVSLKAPRMPTNIKYGDILPLSDDAPEPSQLEQARFRSWSDADELDLSANPARITYRSGEVEWFSSLAAAEGSVERDCYIDDEGQIHWSAGGAALGQIEECAL